MRTRSGKPFIGHPKDGHYKQFCELLRIEWMKAGCPRANSGAWAFHVTVTGNRQAKRLGSPVIADSDIDGPVPVILDALQDIGCLDDDARVTELFAQKQYDKGVSRVLFVLRPLA